MGAFSVIQGFLINKAEPADVRETVANQTARLALAYPYTGLVVREADTKQLYRYTTITPVDGGLPTNIVGDWELVLTVFTGTGAPANGKGAIGDVWIDETNFVIYKKTGAATWTSLFSINGAKIYTGAGVPGGGLGVNGDMYIRSDAPNNGDIYTKAGGAWAFQFSIKGANGVSDQYATTSTDSLDVDTVAAPLAITVGTGLAYTVGQVVIIASRGVPTKNITGTVVAYNPGTGAMTLNPITPAGTGTAETDWDVNLSGAPGPQGKAFIHIEHDITLNDAKITAVEGGVWTKANPWSASILNDSRSSLVAPVALSGSMAGHSIAYDGTAWYDNGRWLGFTGTQGLQGSQGNQGIPGIQGPAGLIPFTNLAAPNTIQNLTKGWYFIDLTTNLSVTFGGGNQDGVIVTVCRTTNGVDSPTPDDSVFSAIIGANGAASLNYKGRYVTSIPVTSRNITFMKVSTSAGIDYWKCVGEDYSSSALVSFRALATNTPSVAHTSEFAIATNIDLGPVTYFPAIGQGRQFKIFVIAEVPLHCDGITQVTLELKRNIDGGGFSVIKARVLKLYNASGASFHVRDVLMHHLDDSLPPTYNNLQYKLTITRNSGTLYRMGNSFDITILPIFYQD